MSAPLTYPFTVNVFFKNASAPEMLDYSFRVGKWGGEHGADIVLSYSNRFVAVSFSDERDFTLFKLMFSEEIAEAERLHDEYWHKEAELKKKRDLEDQYAKYSNSGYKKKSYDSKVMDILKAAWNK